MAQDDNEKIIVVAGVVNKITYRPVVNADAYLMTADSVVVDSMKTFESDSDGSKIGTIYFRHTKEGGKYIICVKHPKYETLYIPFVAKLKKTEQFMIIGSKFLMKLKPMEHKLGEAVVKATKVKFYLKGDTVVYNADAFQLEHGSMLDAILRQMPGVQLKDNGEIIVNGRRVEELLLNGKEFFNHDRQIMLDNLPAYMVKDIKVYEKESEKSKFFGENLDGKKPYVMDVNLKRQYSIGYMGNAEVAGGTENRYLARMFAMRFTPQSRLSLYALMNNINDSRRPGENGDWSSAEVGGGLVATRKGALDYNVEDKKNVFRAKGGAEMKYQNMDNRTFSNSANFLSGGDTYGLSRNSSKDFNTSFYTTHSFRYQKKAYARFSPTFSYSNTRNRSVALASALTENVYKNGSAILDSIFMPASSNDIKRMLINRSRRMGLNRSHQYGVSGLSSVTFDAPWLSPSKITVVGSGSYTKSKSRAFNMQKTEFPKTGAEGIFRNQYSLLPSEAYSFRADISNWMKLTRYVKLTPSYSYSQNYSSANRDLFSFDRLGDETLLPFGSLPSTSDSMMLAKSVRDSYNSMRMNNKHHAELYLRYERYDIKDRAWEIDFHVPVAFTRDNIRYFRDGRRANTSRHYAIFDPSLRIECRKYKRDSVGSQCRTYDIRINSTQSAPDVLYFVPWYKDDTDPMNIYVGNTGLKDSRTYDLSFQRLFYDTGKGVNWHWDINYTITQNALAIGRTYDRNTGISTMKPDNVNGNWKIFGGYYYYTPLDKKRRWDISTFTIANYTNSVDLSGDANASSMRSDVHNVRLSEYINAGVNLGNIGKIGKMRIGAVASVDWYNATSRRKGFNTVNVENLKYGLTYNWNLPQDIDFSTDLMMYSRYGYEDKGMNTNDFVWNARLSKGFMKSTLILTLEGFDILHNLSNITRSLNAQGRVESFSNVIPSYAKLHLTYRLDIKPKKRPGDE